MTAWLLGAALAHPLSPAAWEVGIAQDRVTSVLRVPLRGPPGEAPVPRLPDGCAAVEAPATSVEDGRLVRRETWRCAGTPEVLGLDGLGARNVIATVQDASGTRASVLHAGAPTLSGAAPSSLGLGVRHLLGGLDHVLLVVGLTGLLGVGRPLLVAVTAFTVGHAATLWLAALGWLPIPAALVELAIAATLVLLGVELVVDPGGSPITRRPAWVPLGIGLVHGLGFASSLADAGLVGAPRLGLLLGFNLGLELGQLGVVAVASALLRGVGAPAGVLGWGIGSVGAAMVLERTAAWWLHP